MTPAETYERFNAIDKKLLKGGMSMEERKKTCKEWDKALHGIIPEVGRGCTICYWSDKRAATITKVEFYKNGKPKAVEVTHNRYKCVDYYAGDYEVLPELNESMKDRFTLRRNGRWYEEGQETSPHSVVLMLHYQMTTIDPSY